MNSTTFTVRVGTGVKKRLERLAKSTGRTRSFLAAEAITEYLEINEWQVAGIKHAMASLDRGEGIPHELGQGLGRFLGQCEREANPQEFMTPIWSPEAIADLAALRAYIAQDDPAAAQRVALHIIRNVETLLPNRPEMGRPGRVPGTRELVIPRTPYIVPYRLVGNTIQVLRVFHSARQWPDAF